MYSMKLWLKNVKGSRTDIVLSYSQITELEAAVLSGEKSQLPDVLARVRQEKDTLEKEIAALQQQANATACENDRLKDQISGLQDDLMVSGVRNGGRTTTVCIYSLSPGMI